MSGKEMERIKSCQGELSRVGTNMTNLGPIVLLSYCPWLFSNSWKEWPINALMKRSFISTKFESLTIAASWLVEIFHLEGGSFSLGVELPHDRS